LFIHKIFSVLSASCWQIHFPVSPSGKMPEARWGKQKAPAHEETGRQNSCARLIFSQANDA
jgi:hypothetical protein